MPFDESLSDGFEGKRGSSILEGELRTLTELVRRVFSESTYNSEFFYDGLRKFHNYQRHPRLVGAPTWADLILMAALVRARLAASLIPKAMPELEYSLCVAHPSGNPASKVAGSGRSSGSALRRDAVTTVHASVT